MIYVYPGVEEPIRQGDIFRWMPSIDFDLNELYAVVDEKPVKTTWKNLIDESPSTPRTVLVTAHPVYAIVVTQDCDAIRSPDITLCEIDAFIRVYPGAKTANNPKAWVSHITKHSRQNQKWFYLPSDPRIGFGDKMAVDFRSVTRVGREGLETLRSSMRVGRLNDTAYAHFRERVADFFRRYAYDEWYALDDQELEAYQKEKPEPVMPFPWQLKKPV